MKKRKPIKKTIVVRGIEYWRSAREIAAEEIRRRKKLHARKP